MVSSFPILRSVLEASASSRSLDRSTSVFFTVTYRSKPCKRPKRQVILNSVSDRDSLIPDPDPAYKAEYWSGSGSGSRVLMTKIWQKTYRWKKNLIIFLIKNWILLISRPLYFFLCCVSFLPSWIRMRIQQLKLMPIRADPEAAV